MHGEGRFYMDPKGHIVLDRFPGEWEAMPSYIEEPHAAACKWVSIRERNREKFDLPTVFSILIYTHPGDRFPAGHRDGSYHTVMRTGSAAAVSVKWMARKSSKVLAIVGAGHMAAGVLATCNEVFPWGGGAGVEPVARARWTDSCSGRSSRCSRGSGAQAFHGPRKGGPRCGRGGDGDTGARGRS